MSFLENLGKLLEFVGNVQEVSSADDIFAKGGNCANCKFESNGYCRNRDSKCYGKNAESTCNEIFGVPVCPKYN